MSELSKLIEDSNKIIKDLKDKIEVENKTLMNAIDNHLFELALESDIKCGFFQFLYYTTIGRFLHPDKYLLICKIIKVLETQQNLHKA